MTIPSTESGLFMPARGFFLFLLAAWVALAAWIMWQRLSADTRLPPPITPNGASASPRAARSDFQPTEATAPFPALKDNPFKSAHVRAWNEHQAAERAAREEARRQAAQAKRAQPAAPPAKPPAMSAAEPAAPPPPPPPPPPVHEFRFSGIIELTDGHRVATLESAFGRGVYQAGEFCGPLQITGFDEQRLRLRLRNGWEAVVPIGRPALISAEEWPTAAEEDKEPAP